jgi:hypothetical protein
VLGALGIVSSAGADPESEHSDEVAAFALAVDAEHDIDRPIGDLPVADLGSGALCVIGLADLCQQV